MYSPVKILVADNDEVYHLIVNRMIQTSGYPCITSNYLSAADVLQFTEAFKGNVSVLPDIILLNADMPGTDGWQMAEELHRAICTSGKNTSLYIVSCSADLSSLHRADALPYIKEYIVKPLSMRKIRTIIEDHLLNSNVQQYGMAV
jgi:response regulator RpfG family c-di-GMP phosphodiesterase